MEQITLFELNPIELTDDTEKILQKISSPKKVSSKKKTKTPEDKIAYISGEVKRILGRFAEDTLVIKTIDEFHNYINSCVTNGVVAIDTETNNSLQPFDCKIMGLCLYTPNEKSAYIPINHVDEHGNRLEWQITESQIKDELSRLSETKIIMHNASFDYRVIKCTCGIALSVYWDTQLGAKCLNENESAKLKDQYRIHIDTSVEKYSITHLFEKEKYEIFPPELFALYAATDAMMTYKLYLYQVMEFQKEENKGPFNVFMNIEMQVVIPTAEMELNGVCLDFDFQKRLSEKFHKKYEVLEQTTIDELNKYSEKISRWRLTPDATKKEKKTTPNKNGEITYKKSKSEQLSDLVNLDSPTQVAILLYDVLGLEILDTKNGRSTDAQTLEQLAKLHPDIKLLTAIVQKKHILKQINTYIDKLPECVLYDNKVHGSFYQYGAETGRYSASDPNLQNIPSRGEEKSIRCMFKASDGCVMLGADFSAQEPKTFATFTQDPEMINTYMQGKDLYAVIASKIFHNQYEDNLEVLADGTPYKEGKKRRTMAKSVLLG